MVLEMPWWGGRGRAQVPLGNTSCQGEAESVYVVGGGGGALIQAAGTGARGHSPAPNAPSGTEMGGRQVSPQSPSLLRALLCWLPLGNSEGRRTGERGPLPAC